MESTASFKLETVIGQGTMFPGGMYSSAFGFFMNQGKWDKLSKEDQAAIDKLGYEHLARFAGKSWDEADKVGLEAMKKAGVPVVNADAAFVAEVRKRSEPIIDDWIKKANAKGIDGTKVLAEFREGTQERRRRPVSDPTGAGPAGGSAAPAVPEYRWERRIDAVLGVAASALLMLLMLLTAVDVAGRSQRPRSRGASR